MFVSANTTPFLSAAFVAQDKTATKSCIAVVRATFDVDAQGACRPAEVQSPFVFADAHYGDPADTSVRVETDFCPVKPRCEVLLDAFAIAPDGQRVETLEVALLGPSLHKRAVVMGERRWLSGDFGLQASRVLQEARRKRPLAGTAQTATRTATWTLWARWPCSRTWRRTWIWTPSSRAAATSSAT